MKTKKTINWCHGGQTGGKCGCCTRQGIPEQEGETSFFNFYLEIITGVILNTELDLGLSRLTYNVLSVMCE